MEQSPAGEKTENSSSPTLNEPHKKTAEELVDEMFDSVWLPKPRSPNNGNEAETIEEDGEGDVSEDYDDDGDDYSEEESDGDYEEDSIEDDFEDVETGVQQAVAGKINSISATSTKDEDAERLEQISKQIQSQLESNLRGVNWKRKAKPKKGRKGLRLRARPQVRLRKSKRRAKRAPGSSSIYKSKARPKHKKNIGHNLIGPSAKQRRAKHPGGAPPRRSAELLVEPRPRAPLWAPKEATEGDTEIKGLVLRRGVRPAKPTAEERKMQQRKKMKQKAKRNPWYDAEMKAQKSVQRKKADEKQRRKRKRQRAKDVTQYLQSLATEDWLHTIGREDLGPVLVHEGFEHMHDLLDLTEKELHMLLQNHCGVTQFKERANFHRALRACIKQLLTANELPPLGTKKHPGGEDMGDLRSIVRNTTHASDAQFTLPGDGRLSSKLPPIHPGSRVSKSSDQYRHQMVDTSPPDRANSVT